MSAAQFVYDLVRVVPELRAVLNDHLDDNDTLLPHVIMGDVTRFVIAGVMDPSKRVAIINVLSQLEKGLASEDDDIRELILASFVENLMGESAAVRLLDPSMGPFLKRKVRALTEDNNQ